jgi:amino acid transporter
MKIPTVKIPTVKIPDSLSKAAQQCTAKYSTFVEFFQATPTLIDRRWRWVDFMLNRNYGGILGRKLALNGYSVISLLLPVLAMFFLVGGPMARAGGYETAAIYIAFALALVFLWRLFAKKQEGRHREWNSVAVLQLGLCFLVILVVWFCSTTARPGMECRLYRHSFLILGLILYVVMMPVAWLLARRLFRKEDFAGIDFRSALSRTELFRNPLMPSLTVGAIVRSLVNAPIHGPSGALSYHPHHYSRCFRDEY